jgi:casein kinase II subunit beta
MRWQEERREEMKERLRARGLETGFEEEDEGVESEATEDEMAEEDEDGIDDMFEVAGQAIQ